MAKKSKSKKGIVTHKKIATHLTSSYYRGIYNSNGLRILGKIVHTEFTNDASSFASFVPGYYSRSKKRVKISIGKYHTAQVLNQKPTDEIPMAKITPVVKMSSTIMTYLHLHETGHVAYTDLDTHAKYSESLTSKGYNVLLSIIHAIANVVEDLFLEAQLKHSYPSFRSVITLGQNLMFNKAKYKEFDDGINDESLEQLIFFLLLKYRNPAFILNEHPLYTAKSSEYNEAMYHCLSALDPTLRLNRCMAFGYELYREFFDKGATFDITQVEPGKDMSWIMSLPPIADPPTPPMKVSGGVGSGVETMQGSGGKHSPKHGASAPTPSGEIPAEEKGHGSGTGEEEGDDDMYTQAGRDGGDSLGGSQGVASAVKSIANDEPVCNYSHDVRNMSEFFDSSKYLPHYLEVVAKHENMIHELTDLIKRRKAQNFSRYLAGQRRGKFDKKSIGRYKPDPMVIFKKHIAPKMEAELAFSFLVDNSGSMGGTESTIAGEATIVLSEVCHRLGIPFEVNAFTEGAGVAVTIEMIKFTDDFDSVKSNLTLFTEQYGVSSLHTFSGNVDEANLEYVAKRFLNDRKEKDKVLIVISDGATCGSKKDLKELAAFFDTKFDILGIGVYDTNVAGLYDNHVIIETEEELNKLPTFIGEMVVDKTFK